MQSLRNAFPYPTAINGSYRSEREHFCLAPPKICWSIPRNDGQLRSLEIIDSGKSKSWGIGQTHFVAGGQHVRLSFRRHICKFPRSKYLQILAVDSQICARYGHVAYWQHAIIRQIEDGSHRTERCN